ncbi:cytochrome P450 9e2-like isoform X2 [Tribolium madens]|nr:cytochrome P450 9e2-like isoform X2 [Tribolium madens]
MLLVLLALATAIFCYWKIIYLHSYWRRRGVTQSKPVFLFGDIWPMVVRRYSAPELVDQFYKIDQNARYCGVYQFLLPGLVVRDPELIKQITVKDFDHFVDRRVFVKEDVDPVFGKSLLSLDGEKWRNMRSALSPVFTSSKMKYMFPSISTCGEEFAHYFLKQNKDLLELEMKESITKFTNDVIANTVFGFTCNSLENPNNEFYKMGDEVGNMTSMRTRIVFLMNTLAPKILSFFKISLFSPRVYTFFRQVIAENISSRKKHGITRPDMIDLLVKAKNNSLKNEESDDLPEAGFATVTVTENGKKNKKYQITDEDITAQALLFFFAGFDSVAGVISYMCYELAVAQDVQAKLRKEVDETRERCDGKISYEELMKMKYMHMAVSETLRKWPTAIASDRVCVKPYTIQPKLPNEKPLHLKVGDTVNIPIYAIQRDPQYFPEPDRFIPERFSEENKSKIIQYTYMPFGTGPRSCIGYRFALLEMKILMFHLISNFEIVPVEKTQIPIRFNRKAVNMSAEKGFWVGLKRRVNA